MATHGIFALTGGTDELQTALKAGADLVAKGHDVWLYGREATGEQAMLEGIPFHEVDAEDVAGNLEAIAEELDSILVADFLSTFGLLAQTRDGLERVRKLGKVIVLDPWNIGEGDRVIDTPFSSHRLPKETMLGAKRMVPAFHGGPHAYRDFPDRPEGDVEARRTSARRALGIEKKERVILLTTTTVQVQAAHEDARVKQLIRRTLRRIVELVAKIEGVRVVHVGPSPLEWIEPLADRYTWLVPPGTKHLHNRFAAADAVMTLDLASSAIAWAASWQIPAMAMVNSFDLKTTSSKLDANFALTEGTRAWLTDSTPLPKFRLCPLGLWQTLEPTQIDLAYVPLEILDEVSVLDACRALLFDENERGRAVRDSASCVEAAKDLPTAAELWEKLASA